MNIPETYAYLTRARRDLWAALENAPDDVLSRPVLSGSRFHCIKDLILHIPAVEDSWIHDDLLADTPVWEGVPAMQGAEDGPFYAAFDLETLLDYWRQVEVSTQAYLARLTSAELARRVAVGGSKGEERFMVDGLLWHVLLHEVRHTAQIAMLLRQADLKPPFLDLLNYLPGNAGVNIRTETRADYAAIAEVTRLAFTYNDGVKKNEMLARCARRPEAMVGLWGHPEYDPRFGFRPASAFGLLPDTPAAMVYPLQDDLAAYAGLELPA